MGKKIDIVLDCLLFIGGIADFAISGMNIACALVMFSNGKIVLFILNIISAICFFALGFRNIKFVINTIIRH